jgi:hypothetical protein
VPPQTGKPVNGINTASNTFRAMYVELELLQKSK